MDGQTTTRSFSSSTVSGKDLIRNGADPDLLTHSDRYAVDALQLSLQGIISVQAVLEFQPSYQKGMTIALYIGMLVGALFWGFSADIIGRKIAFNISLFICSIFTIVAGAAPSWESLGFFISMAAFGAGGNLILDTTVFLEYLPSNKQWLVSLLAAWWGVGCTIAGLVAWGFMRMLISPNPELDCANAVLQQTIRAPTQPTAPGPTTKAGAISCTPWVR